MFKKLFSLINGNTKRAAVVTTNGSIDTITFEQLTMTAPHGVINMNDDLGGTGFMVEYILPDKTALNLAFWRNRDNVAEIINEHKGIAKSVGYQLMAEEPLSPTAVIFTFIDKYQRNNYAIAGMITNPENDFKGGVLLELTEGQHHKDDLIRIFESIKIVNAHPPNELSYS